MNILGVILAGGRSARMGGGVKGLLPLRGAPILDHVIRRLQPQVPVIVLNTNADPALFAGHGLAVIADADGGQSGPLAGVLAGMNHAEKSGFELIVTAAADTPFFPLDLVDKLAAARLAGTAPVVMAATRARDEGLDRHPTFAIWPVSLRHDLHKALTRGTRKMTDFADPQGCASVEFPVRDHDPFFNINTPADLILAERILAETIL